MDYLGGLNDGRLKPRLLQSLVRDRLPDEKRPFPSPSQLSSVLSRVKTHGLLSESLPRGGGGRGGGDPPAADVKLAEAWRSAVDAWVERSLSLASSKMPDKCWAGVCLLGVTCEECSSERFLSSYVLWFQKLLLNIQPPADSLFVKVASCASLSDLFTRLVGFSSVKKDATSLASKLIQPVLQLLSDDGTDAIWVGAVDLLCTLLNFFPFSVHRHYDRVEALIVSKIMSAKFSVNMSKKLARCLALLPKVKGDEDSWILMMQKILISINTHMNDAFQGLEEETKSSETMRLLIPPGRDPPPPLGGYMMAGEEQATKSLQELLIPRVSTLLQCCCIMLTSPYPAQVTIPVRPLLSLVGRVLSVDGSLCKSLSSFTTTLHQELLCSELPSLHLSSLDLLTAIIKGVRSQLLPHAANVVRLLTDYFRKTLLPSLRIKVYSIMQILLISMGVGMAFYLAQEVINNAFADLNFLSHGSDSMTSNKHHLGVEGDLLLQSRHKKRKHISGSTKECQNGVDLQNESVNGKPMAPLSVQIAALGALEALVTVGGSLRSEYWRSNVDLLLITVATNACNMGWANEEMSIMLSGEPTSTQADFQLAAFQALLASLLSPAHIRPPYLSQGLELFRRGKQETGTKLAAFCVRALLALEVLIHPRALPLGDFPATKSSTFDGGFNHRKSEGLFRGSQKPILSPFTKNNVLVVNDLDSDDDDDLYDSWLRDGEETGVDVADLDKHNVTNLAKHMEDVEEHVGVSIEKSQSEDHPMLTSDNSHEVAEEITKLTCNVDIEMASAARDENVIELKQLGQPVCENTMDASGGNGTAAPIEGAITGPCDSSVDKIVVPGKDIEAPTDAPALRSDVNVPAQSSFVSSRGKGTMSYDSDSPSLDSLPDIVDGDPDSD